MRISDWSSDVCSSDLTSGATARSMTLGIICRCWPASPERCGTVRPSRTGICRRRWRACAASLAMATMPTAGSCVRSEEHTSELQSLMRISYAVFCLKKKTDKHQPTHTEIQHDCQHHIT